MVSSKSSRLVSGIAMLVLMLGTLAHAQQPAPGQSLSPVAEQIRERVEQWRGAYAVADADKTADDAVADFYEHNKFAPIWARPRDLDQLLAALRDTAGDGLDPEDYALNELQRLRGALDGPQASPQQRAQLDLLATDACLTALMQLYRGKVDPATLDTHWNFDARQVNQAQVLKAVHEALAQGTLGTLFARARPQNPLYAELRVALASLRTVAAEGGWPMIAPGPTLKPGSHDPRVPVLRQRLRLADYPVGEGVDDLYDPALEAELK